MSIPFNANQEVCNQRSGIYAIVNIKTEKFYIGSAVKLSRRKSLHLSDLRKGKHHSSYLQRSYNKHGEEVFVFKVLEYVENKKDLLKVEQKYLDIYFHTGITYNISPTAGSQYGVKRSEETLKRMSLASIGHTVSWETRLKISLAHRRINRSDRKKRTGTRKRSSVVQLDLQNYDIINTYLSIKDAAKNTGICASSISAVCMGSLNMSGGYIWRYLEIN